MTCCVTEEAPVHFGIMAMQIDALIPRSLSPDKAMAHLADFDHAELVRGLASAGRWPIFSTVIGRGLDTFASLLVAASCSS